MPCEVIQPFVVTPGELELRADGRGAADMGVMAFKPGPMDASAASGPTPPLTGSESWAWALKSMPPWEWPLDDLRALHFRHYLQQPTALEFFFSDRSTLLLNFPSRKAAREVEALIRRVYSPPFLQPSLGQTPREVSELCCGG